MDQNLIRNLALLSGGLLVGGAGGYFFAKKKLERKFEKQFEEELKTVKEAYRSLRKRDEFETVEAAATAMGLTVVTAEEPRAEYRGKLNEFEYSPPEETEDVEPSLFIDIDSPKEPNEVVSSSVPTASNVFLSSEVPEVDTPNPNTPYVISIDDFMEDNGFEKNSLTYFSSDDVLVDERELPIDDVEGTVGAFNLANMFGDPHGLSKDENVLYVRNERLEVDFEIALSLVSFAETVLGLGTDQDDG